MVRAGSTGSFERGPSKQIVLVLRDPTSPLNPVDLMLRFHTPVFYLRLLRMVVDEKAAATDAVPIIAGYHVEVQDRICTVSHMAGVGVQPPSFPVHALWLRWAGPTVEREDGVLWALSCLDTCLGISTA